MTMKLLLRENVPHLGQMGDVVTVADGYGRNYLLPRKVAVEVTTANLKRLEAEQKRRRERELERIQGFKGLADRIAAVDITLKERVSGETLYGSVSARDIHKRLADEGLHIEIEMIELPDAIKTLGVHRIPIRLHPEVVAELKVWVVGVKDSAADA